MFFIRYATTIHVPYKEHSASDYEIQIYFFDPSNYGPYVKVKSVIGWYLQHSKAERAGLWPKA